MNKETANHDLKIVQEMISLARNRVTETGFHFLLWGVLVIFASVSQYVLIKYGFGNVSYYVWFAMPVVGVPVAFFYEIRKAKEQGSSLHFDRIYSQLWLGFGIALSLSVFLSISFKVNPTPYILLLVGLATFVSGAILRFTPLIVGAIVFWLAAGVLPLFDGVDSLLVNAFVIFIGYIIPGLLLAKKSRVHV